MKKATASLGQLFAISQAARFLGISDRRVRRLIACGELTAVRSADRRLPEVYEADARAWQERSRTASTTMAQPARDVDAKVRALLGPNDRVF